MMGFGVVEERRGTVRKCVPMGTSGGAYAGNVIDIAAAKARLRPPTNTDTTNSDLITPIRARWSDFLSTQLAAKTTTEIQSGRLINAWRQLVQVAPNIRPPSAQQEEDGYCFTWRFTDREGTLILEVQKDGEAVWMLRKDRSVDFSFIEWPMRKSDESGPLDTDRTDKLPEEIIRALPGFSD